MARNYIKPLIAFVLAGIAIAIWITLIPVVRVHIADYRHDRAKLLYLLETTDAKVDALHALIQFDRHERLTDSELDRIKKFTDPKYGSLVQRLSSDLLYNHQQAEAKPANP